MKKLLLLMGCLILILSACDTKESKKLKGTWNYESSGEEWATIKNGEMEMKSGTYKIKNSETFENEGMRLEAVTNEGSVHSVYYIAIDDQDNNLALVDGEIPTTGETSSFNITRENSGGFIKGFFSFIFKATVFVVVAIIFTIVMDKLFRRNK